MWSVQDKATLSRFHHDHPKIILPGGIQSPIEKAIDDATGAAEEFPLKFIQWFNDNIWGPPTLEAGK